MLRVEWLGRVPYAESLTLQREAVDARADGRTPDRLLLLEHPPVITLGRSTRREHLLASPAELAARGVELHEVQRGGDVTYHGPGQLVGYLIVDLQARGAVDVHAFLREIESGLIRAVAELGVPASRVPGWTGIFAARRGQAPGPWRKLASIGVGLRRWVSFHGFALNVTLDPADFRDIVPCGLHDVEMTSVAIERERAACRAEPRTRDREAGPLGERARDAVRRAFVAGFA